MTDEQENMVKAKLAEIEDAIPEEKGKQEEMNRLVATKIKEIKALNPDLNAVLLALHDENGSVVCAAGDDVDGLASAFLALASSVAIPFVKRCDKDHAAKVNENPKDPANKTTYLFLVYLTALVAKDAGIDWSTHVRMAMDADEMGLK